MNSREFSKFIKYCCNIYVPEFAIDLLEMKVHKSAVKNAEITI